MKRGDIVYVQCIYAQKLTRSNVSAKNYSEDIPSLDY
jgi:hypothetical protein